MCFLANKNACENYHRDQLHYVRAHTHTPFNLRVRKKGSFGKGVFQKNPFLESLENLEILEILENLQTAENKCASDHFLEILENLEILEIPPVKRPLS